jgi:hypothetical protein
MYCFETSYDLLITSHALLREDGKPKPKLETELVFFHRFGTLERELWGKDEIFCGGRSAVLHVQRLRLRASVS